MSVWFKKLANTVDINIQLAHFAMPITHEVHEQNYFYIRNVSTYKVKITGSILIKNIAMSDLMSNHRQLASTRTAVSN